MVAALPPSDKATTAAGEKRVSVVDRAARILSCFTAATPEWTLPQISSRLQIPKPTAFRILATLVRHGLLDSNPATASYTLGFAPLRLADALLDGLDIRHRARPFMRVVLDAVGETVILSIRDGDHRINIDSAESAHSIAQTLQLGIRAPLYAGAASHVFLAAMNDAELDAYLARTKLVAFSPATLIQPDAIRRRIVQVRTQGFALSSSEFTAIGTVAIAVPVCDADGRTVAALHVSGPKGRMTADLQKACVEELKNGSANLTTTYR